MTAYRQQALACAALLSAGPGSPRDLRTVAPDAGRILLRNVYGWFERAQRGVYQLTADGEAALRRWPDASVALSRIRNRSPPACWAWATPRPPSRSEPYDTAALTELLLDRSTAPQGVTFPSTSPHPRSSTGGPDSRLAMVEPLWRSRRRRLGM